MRALWNAGDPKRTRRWEQGCSPGDQERTLLLLVQKKSEKKQVARSVPRTRLLFFDLALRAIDLPLHFLIFASNQRVNFNAVVVEHLYVRSCLWSVDLLCSHSL